MTTNHFDTQAPDWDNHPVRIELARQVAKAIRKNVPLSEKMSALEFGCGTGLVGRELFPNLGKILAIDLSAGMIEQLQKKLEESGIDKITAECRDIFSNPPEQTFDLIFSSMALHHVEETEKLLRCFFDLLNPGGFIALADLDTEDGSFHQEFDGFLHHGFDRDELKTKCEQNGFENIRTTTAHIVQKPTGNYPVFLLTAQRKVSL